MWPCGRLFSGIYDLWPQQPSWRRQGGGRERGMGLLFLKRSTSWHRYISDLLNTFRKTVTCYSDLSTYSINILIVALARNKLTRSKMPPFELFSFVSVLQMRCPMVRKVSKGWCPTMFFHLTQHWLWSEKLVWENYYGILWLCQAGENVSHIMLAVLLYWMVETMFVQHVKAH